MTAKLPPAEVERRVATALDALVDAAGMAGLIDDMPAAATFAGCAGELRGVLTGMRLEEYGALLHLYKLLRHPYVQRERGAVTEVPASDRLRIRRRLRELERKLDDGTAGRDRRMLRVRMIWHPPSPAMRHNLRRPEHSRTAIATALCLQARARPEWWARRAAAIAYLVNTWGADPSYEESAHFAGDYADQVLAITGNRALTPAAYWAIWGF